jgi:hypothetical protein
MSGVSIILSLLLAVVMLASAAMDFRGAPQIIDLVARMGRLPGFERTLGLIKILGALGLLVGLAIPMLGVLAALGLTIYFALAVRIHSKLGDSTTETAPAVGLFAVSALTLLTRFFA